MPVKMGYAKFLTRSWLNVWVIARPRPSPSDFNDWKSSATSKGKATIGNKKSTYVNSQKMTKIYP